MYDFKIRCLFQNIYAIFFNVGTQSIKASLQTLNKGDNPTVQVKTLEQINTAVGYITLIMTIVSRIFRINYNCMYKYHGSRSSFIVKGKGSYNQNHLAYIEGRGIDMSKAKFFLEHICRDAVRILESFRVDIKEIHAILQSADLFRFVETLKKNLFKKVFSQESSTVEKSLNPTSAMTPDKLSSFMSTKSLKPQAPITAEYSS